MDEKNIVTKTTQGQMQRRLHETAEKGKIIQLIIFQLGDEEFGTDIDQVREIVRLGPITPIPDSPDFIKGVTNVRGEIAVVIDLKRRFFLRMKKNIEEKHIIITEQENNLFGLMVDEVSEVLRIPETDIKATPELVTRIDRVYINGVLTLENRLIIMLDLRKVLSEEELTKLSEIRIRHRAAIEKAEEKRAKAADSVERIADSKKKKTKN
ncbi:MAG: chemotaxis protein CheW [Candidatus Omnitrophica bacterium]|nr:chemotaxis protein CheW [Candidatus Omnitrophota bacterium]MBU1366995.1 chemotaxis protein CheW [Candidatus Omnitrophota bacterium]MBU1524681.1 chemotaxis protein CheW [Candidatus Omnitrophota bacterium]MBU1811396.1 chemotaxis protein CheW [Candidatus Omnitrophota bacterium]